MIGLTRRQSDALRFVAGFIEAHGQAPTVRTIGKALGYSERNHTAGVFNLLTKLEERGHIRRRYGRHRAIEVLHLPAIPRAPDNAPLYFVGLKAIHSVAFSTSGFHDHGF
jgi:SOS-response transcriptional repressor LexA